MNPHLVQTVGKRVLAARSRTENLPVVYYELVSTWGSLSLRNNLERAMNFNRGLQGEGERLIRLCDLS